MPHVITKFQLETLHPGFTVHYLSKENRYLIERPDLAPAGYQFYTIIPELLPYNSELGFFIPGHQILAESSSFDQELGIPVGSGNYLIMSGLRIEHRHKLGLILTGPDDPDAELFIWVHWSDFAYAPPLLGASNRFQKHYRADHYPRVTHQTSDTYSGFDLFRLKRRPETASIFQALTTEHARHTEDPTRILAALIRSSSAPHLLEHILLPALRLYDDLRVTPREDYVEILHHEEQLWFRHTLADIKVVHNAFIQDCLACTDHILRPHYVLRTLRSGLTNLFGPIPVLPERTPE